MSVIGKNRQKLEAGRGTDPRHTPLIHLFFGRCAPPIIRDVAGEQGVGHGFARGGQAM